MSSRADQKREAREARERAEREAAAQEAHRRRTAYLAGGIALINSLGNLSGFVAPYVTGGLADLTGSQRLGLWVVGVAMVAGALLALRVGRAVSPSRPRGTTPPRAPSR